MQKNIIFLFFGIIIIGSLASPAEATWYNTSWNSTRALTNTSNIPVALTNYPFQFNITQGSCNANYSDLRITAIDNTTSYSYWINSSLGAWVTGYYEGNSTTGLIQAYAWCGNPTAASQSNMTATGVLVDNFRTDNGILDTSIWLNQTTNGKFLAGQTFNFSGGTLSSKYNITTGTNERFCIFVNISIAGRDNYWGISQNLVNYYSGFEITVMGISGASNWYANSVNNSAITQVAGTTAVKNVYNNWKIILNEGISSTYYYNSGSLFTNITTNVPNKPMMAVFSPGNTGQSINLSSINVRKCAAVEPALSVGSEQTNGGAPNPCACPSINTNWVVDMTLNCVITLNCNIGTGNLTLTNAGNFNISGATLTYNRMIYAGTNQHVWAQTPNTHLYSVKS